MALALLRIEECLDQLNRTLTDLGVPVSKPPLWDAVECLDDCELSEFLSRVCPSNVDRDTLLLTYRLLDRCPEREPEDGRERVVQILGALCDEFGSTYRICNGVAHEVQAALAWRGLDVSPESPRTRASARLMSLRDVKYAGKVYRCEWHAKLERHRNRIRFVGPLEALDGKVLIGIFARHLDTGSS